MNKAYRSTPAFPAEAKESPPPTAHINQQPGSGMKISQPFQSMRINIVPTQSYLFLPETHPILIAIEIHCLFLGRHLGPRPQTAQPTPKQFQPVSNMHHRGRGASARAWNSIGRVSRGWIHGTPTTLITTDHEG